MRTQLVRRKRGFTLPEVLVTVTVVAVLAAVVVPAVTQYVGRGNTPATQTDLEQVRTALQGAITDMRVYPVDLSDLTQASPAGTQNASYYTQNNGTWHGPYLSANANLVTGATGQGFGASGTVGGTASFTSSGLGLAFADTILNSSTGAPAGTLQLVVISPSNCAGLAKIDSAIDDGNSTTGNFKFTAPGGFPYTASCSTSANVSDARYVILTVGK